MTENLDKSLRAGEPGYWRKRFDVQALEMRDPGASRFRVGDSHDKDMSQYVGVDPMSFVYEDSDDEEEAYSFSQRWGCP